MTRNILNVWLNAEHLGELEQLRNGRCRLRFSGEAVDRWGLGTRLLSYALPLTGRRIESEKLDAYLENLLPEGAVRSQLEQRYRVQPGDAFGLLRHIGGECAGAVQLSAGDEPGAGRLAVLAEAEVAAIISELPTLSAPDGEDVGASLGGVQSKVLLTRTPEGWCWPAAGAMSTHLIKPEPTDPQAAIPEIIEYEHWAMGLARAAGLGVAESELVRFGDRLALVVQRYDRTGGRRQHQEDFAQALGIRAAAKYEPSDEATSRLQRIATGPGSEAGDPSAFRRELLQLVTFNVLIGNGDAHAKNYSILNDYGLFAMAPAYDIAPVFYLNGRYDNFGMRVAGQRSLKYLTAGHLVEEACSWGFGQQAAEQVVVATAEAVSAALAQVPAEPGVGAVAERIQQCANEFKKPR